jgi:predicted nucleotidyltransferase
MKTLNSRSMAAQIDAAIQQVLPSIIDLASPRRVLLFGSGATGGADSGSDLDFLVIIDDGRNIGSVTDRLNLNVRNRPMPCDFVVATPSAIRRHKKDKNSVYHHALLRGKELYVAGT